MSKTIFYLLMMLKFYADKVGFGLDQTGIISLTLELYPRFGYGFAQTPSVPLLGGRNKTKPYSVFCISGSACRYPPTVILSGAVGNFA